MNRIRIPCSKNNLKDIRVFVVNTLTRLGVSEAEINMMVLAIDEICANRIIHSNHNDESFSLELKIKKDTSNKVCFEISDEGDPFDHSTYVEPNIGQLIKDKRKGGLGLMLVKRIMDTFEVSRENDLTVCKLAKTVTAI